MNFSKKSRYKSLNMALFRKMRDSLKETGSLPKYAQEELQISAEQLNDIADEEHNIYWKNKGI